MRFPILIFLRRVLSGRVLPGSLLLLASLASAPAHALDSGRYGNVYLSTESLRVLFTQGDSHTVSLLNAQGATISRMTLASTAKEANFGLRSPGYYVVKAGLRRMALVIVVDPLLRVPGESRLATDNAMSNIVDPARFDDVARLLNILGIGRVRERLAWFQLEPTRDQYNWDASSDDAVNALSAQGLQLSEVFHATPTWARSDQNYRRAPDDLRDIYNFSRALAENYQGRVQAWEAWNEPDLAFFDDSASEMAAYQKAAYLGFHAVDPSTHVLSPSMGVTPGAFADHLLQNGMGPYFDIWNYHAYGKTGTDYNEQAIYLPRAEAFHSLLSGYGLGSKPMWVTEAGIPSGSYGIASTTRRNNQAAFLSRALPQSLATGVDRHFWFLFPYFQSANLDWGLFEPGGKMPLPAMAAFATATYALGHAEYRGHLAGLPSNISALVFDRGNDTQVLALWSNTTGTTTVTLPVQWGQVQDAVDNLGSPLLRGTGAVTVGATSAAAFLILPNGLLDAYLTGQPPQAAAPAPEPLASPLVVRIRPTGATLVRAQDIYQVSAGKKYGMVAEVYNFGPDPLVVYAGFDGPVSAFLNQQGSWLTVPAGGRSQLSLTLNVTTQFPGGVLRFVAGSGATSSTGAVLHFKAP